SVNHQVANALLTISRAAAEHFLQLWKPKTSLPYAPIHSHFVFNGKCSATTIVVIANARTAGFHPRERAGRDRSCGGFQQPDYHPQEVFPYPNRSDARGLRAADTSSLIHATYSLAIRFERENKPR